MSANGRSPGDPVISEACEGAAEQPAAAPESADAAFNEVRIRMLSLNIASVARATVGDRIGVLHAYARELAAITASPSAPAA